ncbi:MAG: potassium channel family protein [Pseudomonadota bacterium]
MIRTLLATVVGIIAAGTVFFHIVEGWSWLDSYFFTVVTLSTVGYGSLVPATALGKIGTTMFIFLGVGLVATIIQQVVAQQMQKRIAARQALIEARHQAALAQKERDAALEKGPDA